MAKMIGAKINLSKIPKDKIFEGAKGKYLDITIIVNDEKDTYGNDTSLMVAQTKEEREAGADKTYLGNGKTFWSNEVSAPSQVPQSSNNEDKEDDLPF